MRMLILILSLFLLNCGCGMDIGTIYRINEITKGSIDGECIFHLEYSLNSFQHFCHKYVVGDRIYLQVEKMK